MGKPEDIGQDVWDRADAAFEVGTAIGASAQETIARAILSAVEEERETCAVIVERNQSLALGSLNAIRAGQEIASSIRNRKGA